MFTDLSNIKYFDLSNNNLTFIADQLFEYLLNIKYLNLSHNQIEEIDRTSFENLPKLNNLDLSNNQLMGDDFLWPIFGLNHLNLSHNQFKSLNTSMLDNLDVVEVVGNPWDCKWLMAELMQPSKRLNYGQEYVVSTKKKTLNVPGVECWEADDTKKFIVILDNSMSHEEDVEVSAYLLIHC
jgi:Leucine-rich repeat (LRR) protein